MTARRFIARLLLCLTLGLITTIAIAWTSAILQIPAAQAVRLQTSDSSMTARSTYARTGSWSVAAGQRVSFAIQYPSIGLRWSAADVLKGAQREMTKAREEGVFPPSWGTSPVLDIADCGGEVSPLWMQDARGWPMLALRCQWTWRPGTPVCTADGGRDLAPVHGKGWPPVCTLRALPYRPIPLGLTADTLLFALAWSALLYAPRAIRIARNLCPACGYSLAGLTPGGACPECGKGAA